MFDKVVEWVKANAAEGADVEEFVKMLPRAVDLYKSDDEFHSQVDRMVNERIEAHDKRFTEEKLPGILEQEREKVRKEINPEETAEQKRIRELEERIAQADRQAKQRELRDGLRKKASELGVTEFGLQPDDVEPFVAFGDDAPVVLETFVNKVKENFTTTLDSKLKEKFNAPEPEKGAESEGDKTSFEDRMKSTFLGK